MEAAEPGRQPAADDLGDEGHHHKAEAEQQDGRRQAADVGLQADTGEEDRGKQGVVADVHPALHVGGVVHGAEHDARDVRARDIGNAEIPLGNVGHGKAERHADDGDALGVGVAAVQPEHGLVGGEADDHGHHEEEDGVQQHLAQPRAGAGACPQHTGEDHDADDIVDDRRADDGGAEEAFQVPQLLQRGHRDGHAGGRHDGADEEGLIELRAAHGPKAVERAVQQRAARQRHRHADAGDEGGDGACLEQLLQVGAKAGGEHQQHHADLGKDLNGIAGVHQPQKTGADEQARDDLAHHLRRAQLAGYQPEKLGAEHDDGKVAEN